MASNNALNQTSPNFTVNQITINNAPVVGTDGTNKTYVDMIAAGFDFKNTVLVATTGSNLNATYANGAAGVGATLTNAGVQVAFALDGVTPAVGSRVLVKDQSSTFQNGIYTLTNAGSGSTNWVLTRATDYNTPAQIFPGNLVPVQSGTVNASTFWVQTATVAVIGTDAILFSAFVPTNIPITFNADSGSAVPSANVITMAGGSNITTSGAGSTVTYKISGTTNHNVQIGNAGGSLTSVAPSATLGVPLISQGAAADPVFGTAVVAGGGTGDTSFTAYAVITGGTTATGALQSIASVGSSGNVLTSNGAGALPTFQSPSASSITITGNSGGGLIGNSFTFTGGTTGLTFAGAGTTLTLGGTLAIADGGTNATSMANTDGVVYYDGTRLVTTAVGTATNVLTSNGAGVAPTFQAPAASSITITGNSGGGLTGNSFTFTGGTTGLTFSGAGTTETLTGTLAVANGGTNATSFATTDGTVYYDGTRLVTTATGTSGQLLTSNGAGVAPTYQTAGSLTTAFNSITVQTFTSSGTYTPTSGMQYCTIEVVGGGGGGGGTTTTGAATLSAGAGGGAGGYARKTVTAATIGVSQTVTIGAAGTAGAVGGGTGGGGGTTSVGAIISATGGGGGGGSGAAASEASTGGAGGAGSSGDFNTTGSPGIGGMASGAAAGAALSGAGGSSFFGGGGQPVALLSGQFTGSTATSYGGGGAGATCGVSGTQSTGGAGFKGVVVITEFVH